jgi:hypothetical protein
MHAMTLLALPTDVASPAGQLAARIERCANAVALATLLPGLLLGAVMFVAQSF